MGREACAKVPGLNERTIWLVRVAGIAVILLLFFLLMSLYARLVRLNQERGASPPPQKSTRATELPSTTGGEAWSVNA